MIPMEAQSKIGKDNPRSLLLWIGAIAAMMGISIAIVILRLTNGFQLFMLGGTRSFYSYGLAIL